jgi:hypothetical protein
MAIQEIRIYFEGDKLLKPGFSEFFAELRNRARDRRCKFQLIAAEGGSEACRFFGLALKNHIGAFNILLKDSEGPLGADAAIHLCRDYGWGESQSDCIFWMVEMMEAWFHADKEALEKFYGQGFQKKALKPNPKVEQIPKEDLRRGLRDATANTKPGNYFDNKTSHGPKILESIDPGRVREASPNCDKLFAAVLGRLS